MKANTSTSEFILKTVSPIFNKQGYVGTSLSQLTKATGLTKGAIYCNFENKEDLAVKAFEENVKLAIIPLLKLIEEQNGSLKKLYTITNYFKTYFNVVNSIGGCPMLRVGVDTKFNNPILFDKAQRLSLKFVFGLTRIINEGMDSNEIQKNTDASKNAQIILSIIQGGSLLAFTHNDHSFLTNAMTYIDNEIIKTMEL